MSRLLTRSGAFLTGLAAAGAIAWRLAGLRRFVVEGRSMLPAFAPGDRLLVESVTFRVRAPRPGDVAVVRQPGTGGRLDLKRIAGGPGDVVDIAGEPYVLGRDEWFVAGDNRDESIDSRQLGPLGRRDIVGCFWLRY